MSVAKATKPSKEDNEDPVERMLKKTGCIDHHHKVQECFFEHHDWRKCQDEIKVFKACMDEYQNKERSSTSS